MTDNTPELPASVEPAPESPAPRRRRTVVLALALASVIAVGGVLGSASESGASRYDASVESTIADIQSYWSQTLPSVYHAGYQAIPAERLYAYSASNPPPSCGGYGRTPYSEVAGNAFYCDQGDFVAWDEQGLFAKLRSEYGDFAPALVLAHEWGHAIQARVGFETSETVYMEQQADCFAGAWAAHIAQDGRMAESDLDSALAGLLGLRDPSGIDGSEDGAHGNGFDRVRAFQDGFEGGASACANYAKNPPTITESAFTSYADYASGGDMSLNELLPALTKSLQSYWSSAVSGAKSAPEVVAADGTQASACGGTTDGGVLSAAVVYCPRHRHDRLRPGCVAEGTRLGRRLRRRRAARVGVVVGGAATRRATGRLVGRACCRDVPHRFLHGDPRRQHAAGERQRHHPLPRRPRRGDRDAGQDRRQRRLAGFRVLTGVGLPHRLLQGCERLRQGLIRGTIGI